MLVANGESEDFALLLVMNCGPDWRVGGIADVRPASSMDRWTLVDLDQKVGMFPVRWVQWEEGQQISC